MARRHEMTEEDWRRVEPHLPPRVIRRGGRKFRDGRQVLDGILWVLHAGAQWREMPERYGPWSTAYRRHARWSVDGTNVRAGRSAAGAKRGRAAAGSRRTTPSAAAAAAGARSCTS